MNQDPDLPAVLTELIYGDEVTEPLEKTLDRLLAPRFVLRINGQIYDRSGFIAHVRELRQISIGGGKIQVLEQISTDNGIAGRYLFRMISAEGKGLSIEAHLFAKVSNGKIGRIAEIARQVGDDAEENFLADT
jgi:hypothetical protein